MKYFFIAGERSGDQHAAFVIRELLSMDKTSEIVGWGGSLMERSGARILKDYRELSFMGFLEVFKNLRTIRRQIRTCKQQIAHEKPDVLVLVDYPGFNLKIAAYAHKLGIKTCYFISPKVWAWNQTRVTFIKRYVNIMLCILPFEPDFYKVHDFKGVYVGNPIVEQLGSHPFDQKVINKLRGDGKKVAILPGSRLQEINYAIPVILKLAGIYEDYVFLVAAVENVHASLYDTLSGIRNIKVYFNKTYELLKASDVAIVTSGTATLEAAYLNVPQVVVYKTSVMTYWIAKWMARVRYISLVNILAGRRVVKELIQSDYNAVDVAAELEWLLHDAEAKKRISEGYSEIRHKIGNEQASKNAAKAIYGLASK